MKQFQLKIEKLLSNGWYDKLYIILRTCRMKDSKSRHVHLAMIVTRVLNVQLPENMRELWRREWERPPPNETIEHERTSIYSIASIKIHNDMSFPVKIPK